MSEQTPEQFNGIPDPGAMPGIMISLIRQLNSFADKHPGTGQHVPDIVHMTGSESERLAYPGLFLLGALVVSATTARGDLPLRMDPAERQALALRSDAIIAGDTAVDSQTVAVSPRELEALRRIVDGLDDRYPDAAAIARVAFGIAQTSHVAHTTEAA